ncbi:MAG: response regulator [Planctomycetales bacterium]|jgi:CheY-like chemotaxis protein
MDLSAQTIDDLKAEIESRMGVCPSFFLLPEDITVSQQLWAAASFGYLDAPFPALFKERLFAYLSRFCRVPYCVSRHAAFLLGAGNVAGDSSCPAMTPQAVVDTLQKRLPSYTAVTRCLGIVASLESPFNQWGEDAEAALFPCLAAVFLQSEGAEESERQLFRLFGPAEYDRLVWFLGFIRTAHFWTETHPELELEDDVRMLFDKYPEVMKATSLLAKPGKDLLLAGKTVLIVDDDESIRDSLRLLLEFEGVSVLTCEDSGSALVQIGQVGDSVDVLVIDVTLPEVSGPECLELIRGILPYAPAILVSGFSEADLESPLNLDERTRFLTKPCSRQTLVDMLKSLLAMADVSAA